MSDTWQDRGAYVEYAEARKIALQMAVTEREVPIDDVLELAERYFQFLIKKRELPNS